MPTQLPATIQLPSPLSLATRGNKITEMSATVILHHFRKLFVIIGLPESKIPTEMEINFMVESYKTEFREYTLQEIELAISLALQNKINYDLNLYDRPFSIAYMSGLLKVYKEYKTNHPDTKKAIAAPELPPHEPSKDEIYQIMRHGILELYAQFKAEPAQFDFQRELKWFYYSSLCLSPHFNPTAEQKKQAMIEAEKIQRQQLINERIKKIRITDLLPRDKELQQIDRAKEVLMKNHFEHLYNNNLELILPENL